MTPQQSATAITGAVDDGGICTRNSAMGRARQIAQAIDEAVAAERLKSETLAKAAADLLAEIELVPGGYDYRPHYRLRNSSQLNDPDAAVIRLRKALAEACLDKNGDLT